MKIPTKTLASLLLMTSLSVATASARGSRRKEGYDSRYDRLLQRHDRKGELRSAVLGISLAEFRLLERQLGPEAALRARGFTTIVNYRMALLGKIRHELRQQGWTSQRIDRHVELRISRVT